MAKIFSIDCSCGEEVRFEIEDVADLSSFIDDEKSDAADDARNECDWDDAPDPGKLVADRVLFDLSVAIERGDKGEARLLLDRVAAELGSYAGELCEQVQQGRFSLQARQ